MSRSVLLVVGVAAAVLAGAGVAAADPPGLKTLPIGAVAPDVTVCMIPNAKGGPFVLWDNLPAAIRTAAALGFDAVELFPPEPDTLVPQTVKDLLAPHNLAVSAVGSGAGWVRHQMSLTHRDPATGSGRAPSSGG